MNGKLKDKLIFVSKSENESRVPVSALIDAGAELIFAPAIEIIPIRENSFLDKVLQNTEELDYIVFASANSVNVFSEYIRKTAADLSAVKISVLGGKTFETAVNAGFSVDLVPGEFSAAGLIKMFSGMNVAGKKFLIPCSDIARDELENGLVELKADVIKIPIYKTKCFSDTDFFRNSLNNCGRKPDVFVFTSPSSFNCFCELLNINSPSIYFSDSLIAAIGGTTAKSIEAKGLHNVMVHSQFTLEGISESIINHFAAITDKF